MPAPSHNHKKSLKLKNWLWEQTQNSPDIKTKYTQLIYKTLKEKYKTNNDANNTNPSFVVKNIQLTSSGGVSFYLSVSPEKQQETLNKLHQVATVELQQNLGVQNNLENFLQRKIENYNANQDQHQLFEFNVETTHTGGGGEEENQQDWTPAVALSLYKIKSSTSSPDSSTKIPESSNFLYPEEKNEEENLVWLVKQMIEKLSLKKQPADVAQFMVAYQTILNQILNPLVYSQFFSEFIETYHLEKITINENNTSSTISEILVDIADPATNYTTILKDKPLNIKHDNLVDAYTSQLVFPTLFSKYSKTMSANIEQAIKNNLEELFDWNASSSSSISFQKSMSTVNYTINVYVDLYDLSETILDLVSGNIENFDQKQKAKYKSVKQKLQSPPSSNPENLKANLFTFNVNYTGISANLNIAEDTIGLFLPMPSSQKFYDWNLQPNSTSNLDSLFIQRLNNNAKITQEDLLYLFEELPWFQEIKTIFQ